MIAGKTTPGAARWAALLACFAWVDVACAQMLVNENFDSTAVGSLPSGWTATTPAGTAAAVSNNLSSSSPNSLRFDKTTGSGGDYPEAVVSFNVATGNLVRISYKARTSTSNHDPLYVKLRNAAMQEVGGLRFTTTAAIQYQLPSGAWSNTGYSYAANVWYTLAIEFDMTAFSYSAWLNGTSIVQNAAFRTNTTTAGSVLIQDRVAAGSGTSYIDDFTVEQRLKIVTNTSPYVAELVSENYDSTSDGALPSGWSKVTPTDTSVGVASDQSVSSPKSLALVTVSNVSGQSASAIYTFSPIYTWGVLVVRYDARTSSTNHDSLYAKMRHWTGGFELGGVRFNPTGVFAYQKPDGTWQPTSVSYQSNTWYNMLLAYDLEQGAFSAYANGQEIVAYAPFRSGSTNKAHSFIFQDRTFLGTGTSYVDNFSVVQTVPPANLALSISASTNYARAGDPVTVTITVTNRSSRYAGVYTVTNVLPASMSVQSGTTPGYVVQGNTVSWLLSGLAGNAATTLTLVVSPGYNGSTQEVSVVLTSVVNHAHGDDFSLDNSTSSGSITTVGIPMLGLIGLFLLALAIGRQFRRAHARKASAC